MMSGDAIAPGKQRRPSDAPPADAESVSSAASTAEEIAAATKIQALYRAHSFRTDPDNEELLDELHRRLEAIGAGEHDHADDIGAPNSPSRARKPVLMSPSTAAVMDKAEKEIEQHIKEGKEEKQIDQLEADKTELAEQLAEKEREQKIIKSQAYMRGALARKHYKERLAQKEADAEANRKHLAERRPGLGGLIPALFTGVEVTPQQQAKMRKRCAVLMYDLAQKDTYIERLVAEVNDRSEALRTSGVQLAKLREENAALAKARAEVAGRVAALAERTAGAAADAPWRKSTDPRVYAAGLAEELRKEQRMGPSPTQPQDTV